MFAFSLFVYTRSITDVIFLVLPVEGMSILSTVEMFQFKQLLLIFAISYILSLTYKFQVSSFLSNIIFTSSVRCLTYLLHGAESLLRS